MVSFQCDACQDVVKKPKLDNHSHRCHASFTCVDCSKTFYSSGEWKGHTQCISEAEKYQKALYKGKKNNGASGPRGARPSNTVGIQPVTQAATKASDLEEEHRSQPPSSNEKADGMDVDAAVESVEQVVKENGDSREGKRKRKSEALNAPEETSPAMVSVEEGGKRKKSKKSDVAVGERAVRKAEKSKASDESNAGDASRATSGAGDFQPVDEKAEKKKRKDKKTKKPTGADSKAESSPRAPDTAPSSSALAELDGESVKKAIKRRKGKADDDAAQDVASPGVISDAQDASPAVKSSESKKRKRKDKSKKRDKKNKEDVQAHHDADEVPKNSATDIKQKSELLSTEGDAHLPPVKHAREKDDKKKRKEKRKKAEASTS